MPPIRARVIIKGRVQGVFFRDTCKRQAQALGIAGWVRNTNDGDVEAVFEGPPTRVEAMIEWCRRGPPRARVDSIEVTTGEPEGLTTFRITG